jgi:diguanylate cyclase (GGDEF)-like protein
MTPSDLEAHDGDQPIRSPRVAGRIVRAVMGYVDQVMGPEGVASIAVDTGVGAEALAPEFDRAWVPYELMERVAHAAAHLVGDPEIGRRAGEFSFHLGEELHPVLLATGSPEAAVREAVGFSNRTRTASGFTIEAFDERAVVVRSNVRAATRFACAMSLGYWSSVPSLFGATGYATEPRCRTRGDDVCEYRISWVGGEVSESSVDDSRRRSESLVERFEEMHSMAAELAQQETVDELLHKIAQRAGTAVMAPSVIVMVRLTDDEPMSFGWSGLEEHEVHEIALAFANGLYDESDRSTVVAEIATRHRSYGHLVAFNHPSTRFGLHEKRMLGAYSSFASAAIEAAAALEDVQVQRDRSESLLGLARTLAEVGSTQEIAQRIAEAVPTIVRCGRSGVAVWRPEDRTLDLLGAWPRPVAEVSVGPIALDSLPGAAEVARTLVPALVDIADCSPSDAAMLRTLQVERVALAPIVVRGELRGTVSAELGDDLDVDETLRRLSGLADHAAAALDNSALLDEVRHQALHDPLTGLPNRTLAEDRVRHALEVAERLGRWVTLLFVDLDEFKAVNDRLGHAAGDDLLREAAVRLRACVRTSDTVCRLGGDEFLVLLENTSGDVDGSRAAEEIIAALREPFVVRGEIARVSASVGITSAPGRGTHYDELLARADEAMYEVKRRGRDGWAVFAS